MIAFDPSLFNGGVVVYPHSLLRNERPKRSLHVLGYNGGKKKTPGFVNSERKHFIHISLLGTTASPFIGNWNLLIQRPFHRHSSWRPTAARFEFSLGHVRERHLRRVALFSCRVGRGVPAEYLLAASTAELRGPYHPAAILWALFGWFGPEISSPRGYWWPFIEWGYR